MGPTRFPFPKASQMQVPLRGALLWHLRVRVTDISTDNPTISSNIPHHSCHSFMLTRCQTLCRVAFCPCDGSFAASLAVGFWHRELECPAVTEQLRRGAQPAPESPRGRTPGGARAWQTGQETEQSWRQRRKACSRPGEASRADNIGSSNTPKFWGPGQRGGTSQDRAAHGGTGERKQAWSPEAGCAWG